MKKIPTLFKRDDKGSVINEVTPGCEWVLAGEGEATEKLDGTNVRLTVRSGRFVRVEKRKNPAKGQKERGIVDPWYEDACAEPCNKWIMEAVALTNCADWPDGEHCCEALGPKIQGNPLGLKGPACHPFNGTTNIYAGCPRDFVGLQEFLKDLNSIYSHGHLAEGIVFHHRDGRRAKIKRKDFSRAGRTELRRQEEVS